MTNAAIFIDLPNFYSRLLQSGIEDPRLLRDYFLYGLDFDLLAQRLTDTYSGIWVFYSGQRLGPSSERITDNYLTDYINRINALEGVTARDVNIPGQQREPIMYQCEECHHTGTADSKGEKGIDASLIVHLFDTIDYWDVAYLLSGDADFVPAVQSLRRKGKIIIGTGFPDASPALIRECYDYVNLNDVFLMEDLAIYTILKKDNGLAYRWLTADFQSDPKFSPSYTVRFQVEWSPRQQQRTKSYFIMLRSDGALDPSDRQQLIADFIAKFPNQPFTETIVEGSNHTCRFEIGLTAWNSASRRLNKFTSMITENRGISIKRINWGGQNYSIDYAYNSKEKKYELVLQNSVQ